MVNKGNFIDIFNSMDESTGDLVERSIIIPIIQRDYAQGRTDEQATRVREKFLNALYAAVTEKPITLDFIYGDVNGNNIITLLDGQQRVTTLFLLYWYAAKRDGVKKSEYQFLKRFSYETRYSSRIFCNNLVDYLPNFDVFKISSDIEDQAWFTLGWKNDPTIKSMLVMLDAIHEKFKDVPNLWEKLKSDTITFYFLPVEEMGLTDELYIKMNSRGRILSEFENFKAELEGVISKYDREKTTKKAYEISKKIDGIWTDLLWGYKDGTNTIDNAFLKYFRVICQIIAYKDNQTFNKGHGDSFDLLEKYFDPESSKFEEHLQTMESYFDVWHRIFTECSLKDFFARFLTIEHDGGKVKIGQRYSGEIDLFKDCVSSDNYTLPKLILLYAFIIYIDNRDSITEEEFCRRLRVVNNLIQNSQEEISDLENRAGGNRMPAILRQTDSIIISGVIDASSGISFNANQLEEESEKLEFTAENPELSEALFALEDHELLTGQISVVGLEYHHLFDRFNSLFACDYDKINCALLAIGDYGQEVGRNYGIFQYGAMNSNYSWKNLFHRSAKNAGFETTHKVLVRLLEKFEVFSDERLCDVSQKYITSCEDNHEYDWRYYFIKYDSFRPDSGVEKFYGKYYKPGLNMLAMVTEKRLSENAFDPFLKEVGKRVRGGGLLEHDKDGSGHEYGYLDKLFAYGTKKVYSFIDNEIEKMNVEYTDEGYLIYNKIESIQISQNTIGVDSEDRVKKLIDIIDGDVKLPKIEKREEESFVRLKKWKEDVLECVQRIPNNVFSLDDVYAFQELLKEKHPANNNILPKIRQQLQILRDEGKIEFIGGGKYKKNL